MTAATALSVRRANVPTTPDPLNIGETVAALEIFERIPPRDFDVAAVRDRSCLPLIRPGEVVVVDLNQTIPVDGGLFVIEYPRKRMDTDKWVSPSERNVVVTFERGERWWVRRPRGVMADGPYPGIYELEQRLLGRVVGIFNPSSLQVM